MMWWVVLYILAAFGGFAAGQAIERLHVNPRNLRRARSEAYDKGWVDGYDIGTKGREAAQLKGA